MYPKEIIQKKEKASRHEDTASLLKLEATSTSNGECLMQQHMPILTEHHGILKRYILRLSSNMDKAQLQTLNLKSKNHDIFLTTSS